MGDKLGNICVCYQHTKAIKITCLIIFVILGLGFLGLGIALTVIYNQSDYWTWLQIIAVSLCFSGFILCLFVSFTCRRSRCPQFYVDHCVPKRQRLFRAIRDLCIGIITCKSENVTQRYMDTATGQTWTETKNEEQASTYAIMLWVIMFFCWPCILCGVCCVCGERIIDQTVGNADEHDYIFQKASWKKGLTAASKEEVAFIKGVMKHTWIYKDHAGRDATGLSHSGLKVLDIWKITKSSAKSNYMERLETMNDIRPTRELIRNPILTSTLDPVDYHETMNIDPFKEVLLFHGTSTDVLQSILDTGFDMAYAQEGLYGRGMYFAESCQKSDQYADFEEERRETRLMLFLCRVALGNMRSYDDAYWSGSDSVVAGFDKKFREFILTDQTQCFPEYVIIYKRVWNA